MIEAKRDGLTVGAEPPRKRAPVIDLMQALQKSLGELPRKPAAKATGNEVADIQEKRQAGTQARTAYRARIN